jgi:hypothetical protein
MKIMHFILLIVFTLPGMAQSDLDQKTMSIDGHVVTAYIDECGDTIILADLEDVSITSFRDFESREERLKYYRYRRYALKVYPYATEAIKIFREVQNETNYMSKRKRKKHLKRLNKELKDKFEDPLRKLTKTQGLILTKMIEKELDTPMYQLIKNMRGGMTAGYWNTIGQFNGYKLKNGYIRGEDPILDAVLDDFNISYDL